MKKTVVIVLVALLLLSFSACKQSETEGSAATPEKKVLSVGETVETDVVKLTLNKIQFTDKVGLDHSNWLKPQNGSGGLTPGEGKIYVWFSFTVKNMSKDTLSGYDVCKVKVDYNNGYIYEDAVYSSEGLAGWSTNSSISNNVGLPTMEPLEENIYYGYISCVADVKTNREAPLFLVFTVPNAAGTEEIHYQYAPAEDADTSAEALAISDSLNNAIDELTFVQKYAGNTNNSGSRKFADTKIESIRNSLSGMNIEYVNAHFPLTAAALPGIQDNIASVCEMLIEMGTTNSDENVYSIRTMAGETIEIIRGLLSAEFSAFN